MIRLRRPAAAIAVLALGLSGCGVVTPGNTVASVDDETLTEDDLAAIMTATDTGDTATGDTATGEEADAPADPATIDMGAARNIIGLWVVDRVIADEATIRGLDVEPLATDTPSVADLQTHVQQNAEALIADLSATAPTEQEVQAAYGSVTCFNAVVAPTDDAAKTIVAALKSADTFAEFATTQPEGATGFIGCFVPETAAENVANTYEPSIRAYGDELASAAPGEVIGPITAANGVWILQRTRLEELDSDQQAQLIQDSVFPQLIQSRDIRIASMYGTFSLANGVIPLGIDPSDLLGG